MSLYLEACYGSLNKHGEELCGDKVEIVRTNQDLTMVLADGLGSGVKANILASLTSKIVSTMLLNGAEVTDVIETMASTLPVCNVRKVAYSTFTFLKVDVEGNAHIVEYDNPPIIVLRNGKSLALDRNKLEIEGKTILETHLKLEPNDICIFFSDGAVHAGVGKLLNLGWQFENIVEYLQKAYHKNITANQIQALLLSACNNLYMNSPGDDTTVAVCRIRIPTNIMILVGPPVDSSDDEKIIDRLVGFDGLKVVCGGTTAQIVSRHTGHPIKASLEYMSPDVPPIAKIKGIDLVTEGVITLGKVLEYLKNYENISQGSALSASEKMNGAFILTQLLIERATGVQFIVGRALNPAHQNPNLPINLSIKLRLVEDIASILTQRDKEVSVEFH